MNFKPGDTSGKDGIYWLNKILEIEPLSNVIMITAYGEVNVAVDAIKSGAIDFVVKPWQNEKLLSTVTATYKYSQSKKTVSFLKSQKRILSSTIDDQFTELIGQSPAIKNVFESINKVAETDVNVLILGENGTGKELVARALHRNSARSNEVFISVDLGSLSETLFESELFGHKKGAFTDAKEDRIGRFEAASGGTLFLDEIGNLSTPLQAKLLNVLQNRQIFMVGSNKPIDIDIRLICATNKHLQQMVTENIFRQDLLYRVNTVEIILPPLRNRIEDIPLLAKHFLEKYCKKYNKVGLKTPDYVIKKLQKFDWPGNIRELQHALERAVILSDGKKLHSADFHFLGVGEKEDTEKKDFNLEKLERIAIKNCLKKNAGNVTKAAEELGLTRGSLYRRMDRYDL